MELIPSRMGMGSEIMANWERGYYLDLECEIRMLGEAFMGQFA